MTGYRDGFESHAARLKANMIVAQCEDLMLHEIVRFTDGSVKARLGDIVFTLDWNPANQSIDIVNRERLTPVLYLENVA